TLLHGDVLMWLMKTLLTSGCTNQRGAGQVTPVATYCGGIADAFHSTCNQCSAICSKMLFDIAVHISVTLTLNISLIFIYLV
ncbi:hypothetical protein, partial [Enterobacter hormaechei]